MGCEEAYDELIDKINDIIVQSRAKLMKLNVDNPNPPSERYSFGEHIRIKSYGEILMYLKHNRIEFITKCNRD